MEQIIQRKRAVFEKNKANKDEHERQIKNNSDNKNKKIKKPKTNWKLAFNLKNEFKKVLK